MRKTFAFVAALTFVGMGAAQAQQPAPAPQAAKNAHAAAAKPTTQRQAKHTTTASAKVAISADSARALVMARMPKATIVSEKLRRRHGRLMYDVQYREAGSKAVHTVRVDATTGAVTEHPMAAASTQKARKRS